MHTNAVWADDLDRTFIRKDRCEERLRPRQFFLINWGCGDLNSDFKAPNLES